MLPLASFATGDIFMLRMLYADVDAGAHFFLSRARHAECRHAAYVTPRMRAYRASCAASTRFAVTSPRLLEDYFLQSHFSARAARHGSRPMLGDKEMPRRPPSSIRRWRNAEAPVMMPLMMSAARIVAGRAGRHRRLYAARGQLQRSCAPRHVGNDGGAIIE